MGIGIASHTSDRHPCHLCGVREPSDGYSGGSDGRGWSFYTINTPVALGIHYFFCETCTVRVKRSLGKLKVEPKE